MLVTPQLSNSSTNHRNISKQLKSSSPSRIYAFAQKKIQLKYFLTHFVATECATYKRSDSQPEGVEAVERTKV